MGQNDEQSVYEFKHRLGGLSYNLMESASYKLEKKPSGKNYIFQAKEFDEKVTFLCSFCGGQRCPQEDYLTNKKQPNAIKGLHSNWITDNILAMQRPSERLIKEFNLYESWRKEGITTILNLQEPGEVLSSSLSTPTVEME